MESFILECEKKDLDDIFLEFQKNNIKIKYSLIKNEKYNFYTDKCNLEKIELMKKKYDWILNYEKSPFENL